MPFRCFATLYYMLTAVCNSCNATHRRYDVSSVKLSTQSKEQFVDTFTQRGLNCPSGDWQLVWNITDLPHAVPAVNNSTGNAGSGSNKNKGTEKRLGNKKTKKHPRSSSSFSDGGGGNSGITVDLLNPSTAYITYGAGTEPQFAGEELTPFHILYHEHAVYLTRFPPNTGYIWGPSGMVHATCTVIGLFGCMLPTQEIPIFADPGFANVVSIKDPVVTALPMHNSGNYYHWLCEGLARLLWLKEHILDNDNSGDSGIKGSEYKVLVPGPNIRHIDQTLSLLGIPESQRLYYPLKTVPNLIYAFVRVQIFSCHLGFGVWVLGFGFWFLVQSLGHARQYTCYYMCLFYADVHNSAIMYNYVEGK